jgi:dTMP kinase
MSLLVTFEGGEGAGKTTLIEKVAQKLQSLGVSVLKTREPGGTALGEMVRNILLHKAEVPISMHAELCLFLASRAQHLEEVIKPALKQQKVVLCDRFNDSTIAYQGAARGLGMEEVAHVCRFISGGVEPDLTFYLDIEPSLGLKRAKHRGSGQDRMETEALLFHQKIREAYLLLHARHPKRIRLIDALQPEADVFLQAMHYLEPHLQQDHV